VLQDEEQNDEDESYLTDPGENLSQVIGEEVQFTSVKPVPKRGHTQISYYHNSFINSKTLDLHESNLIKCQKNQHDIMV
jgi:hypothetical protein